MNSKYFPLAASIVLSACASTELDEASKRAVDEAVARSAAVIQPVATDSVGVSGTAAHADRLAQEQRNMPVLRRSRHAFIGTQLVPVTSDDRLPTVFRQEYGFEFDDARSGRAVSLSTMAARLTALTGVPVRIHPDVYGAGAGMAVPVPQATPPVTVPAVMPVGQGGDGQPPASAFQGQTITPTSALPLAAGDMRWKGTLTGYLNHLTDRLGLAWEYRDNTIVIMRFVSESHEIASIQGETDYRMSMGGGSTGTSNATGAQSSAAAQMSVLEAGKIAAVSSIVRTVQQMVSSVHGSSVTHSEGSGRLLVKTTREMQSQVRDYIKAENRTMTRQAQIQFDIYSVRTENADERGINWALLFRSLSNTYQVAANSAAAAADLGSGTIGVSILAGGASTTSQRFGDSQAIVSLLRQHGTNVQHRPISLLALNRMWTSENRMNSDSYLAETTPGPASSTGVGAPGLRLGEVVTGDQYAVFPQILDNNTVLLKFGISLSDLIGLFDVTVGQGLTQQKVQAPRVSSTGMQYTIKLEPGQVVAITGLSRLVTTTDHRSLADGISPAVGGSRKANQAREHFIVFVRSVIS